jgi:hypothetical protein
MSGKGQSSDMSLASFDPHGMPLIPGLTELVEIGDALAGSNNENVGKLKIYAWKGPDYISNPETDSAGVDWILGEKWWPYQRGTFVTPPFAGYLSGHSTFSRAAAEVLTRLTGDPFFPGGIGTFDVVQNDFLVFEPGPSQNMSLQWATYRDASDQTSLSRIWGGIHPPIDDIKGRIIGHKIGNAAFDLALDYFQGSLSVNTFNADSDISLYPIPFKNELTLSYSNPNTFYAEIVNLNGQLVYQSKAIKDTHVLNLAFLNSGIYFIRLKNVNNKSFYVQKIVKN